MNSFSAKWQGCLKIESAFVGNGIDSIERDEATAASFAIHLLQ